MISVLILTFNEETNIAECIASLPWRSDVLVLDSGSSDRTCEIASDMGAKVITRPFTNYADQRNFGLSHPFDNEWIVSLDADERMTQGLALEIERNLAAARPEVAMYRMRRMDMFLGRWLRRSSGYPTWFPRVFRRGRVRIEREVNEVYVAQGITRQLDGHILHFPFNNGLEWWVDRHNRYSTLEARVLNAERAAPVPLSGLCASDPGRRRATLKAMAYRVPGRPLLAFFYLYILRFGFLDGAAGYHFACLRVAYEIMIDAKMAHQRLQGLGARAPSQTPS